MSYPRFMTRKLLDKETLNQENQKKKINDQINKAKNPKANLIILLFIKRALLFANTPRKGNSNMRDVVYDIFKYSGPVSSCLL